MATNAENDNENDTDFHRKTEAFMTWLQHRPGATISPSIRVADLRQHNAGRGVVAVEDIEADEELFSVPCKDVLSVENSSLYACHSDIFEILDSWNSLVLTLIYEDGQGLESEWWPYLNILPTNFDTLMYWSPGELAELQGSAVLDKIGKETAEVSFIKILLPIVQKHWKLFAAHAEAFHGTDATKKLVELAHRMATLIMAYGFDLQNEPPSERDEEEEAEGGSSQQGYELNKGMVPLADMFNANGDLNNAHLLQDETSMTMISLKRTEKGEQMFNDFGQLPRSDLLRRYGYITDQYKKWDVVEINIDAVTAATAEHNNLSKSEKEQRLRLANDWEVLQDSYDLSKPAEREKFEFDHDLMMTITALLLNAEDYEKAVAAEEPLRQPPASMRKTLYQVFKNIVTKRHEAFETTIAEDTQLLADPCVQGRRRMAIEVRLGEKEILAIAADEIDKQCAKMLQTKNQADNSNNVKRRKV